MLPNVNEIMGFIEVAQVFNITKAAHRMGISQPALSTSLKKLEENLGETLFIRSKDGVELTVVGKKFLLYAQELLSYWEKVKSETLSSVQEVKGTVRLGTHPSVALYTLPYFIPQMMQEFKALNFELVHDLSRKIVDQVIHYELDLGLVINPIKHPDLIQIKLCEDEVRIWMTQEFNHEVMICNPELLQTQKILKELKKTQILYKRVMTSTNLELITQLTLQGGGYGIIPGRVVNIIDQKKQLRPLSKSPLFKDELYLVYRLENKNVEFIKKIKAFILNYLNHQFFL